MSSPPTRLLFLPLAPSSGCATDLGGILADAERWRRMSTRAAVLNSRCSRYLPTSPRWENWRGFLLHPSDCVLPHVNLLGSDVVSPSRGIFRRVYSSE